MYTETTNWSIRFEKRDPMNWPFQKGSSMWAVIKTQLICCTVTRDSGLYHPVIYAGIIGSHDEDPYEPIGTIEHTGFERSSCWVWGRDRKFQIIWVLPTSRDGFPSKRLSFCAVGFIYIYIGMWKLGGGPDFLKQLTCGRRELPPFCAESAGGTQSWLMHFSSVCWSILDGRKWRWFVAVDLWKPPDG